MKKAMVVLAGAMTMCLASAGGAWAAAPHAAAPHKDSGSVRFILDNEGYYNGSLEVWYTDAQGRQHTSGWNHGDGGMVYLNVPKGATQVVTAVDGDGFGGWVWLTGDKFAQTPDNQVCYQTSGTALHMSAYQVHDCNWK